MIVLSFVLVIVAAVTLIIGLFQDTLAWIWTSIASCVVAMIFLGIGVLQRRGRTTPATADAGYSPSSGGSGTLVRAGEKSGAEREEREEVSVVPRTTSRDARPQTERADTSEVEPTVLPKRTAARTEREPEPEEAAVTDEDIRPVKKAPSRRAAAQKRSEAAEPATSAEAPAAEPPAKKAAKRSTRKAAKGTAAKRTAAKKTAKKAAAKKATTGAAAARKLGQVKGVGAAKQQALLDAFGSLEAIRDASVEELTAIKGIGEGTAEELKSALS